MILSNQFESAKNLSTPFFTFRGFHFFFFRLFLFFKIIKQKITKTITGGKKGKNPQKPQYRRDSSK